MTLFPIVALRTEICDVTGLPETGVCEIHQEGLVFASPHGHAIGLSWEALHGILQNPKVIELLEEASGWTP